MAEAQRRDSDKERDSASEDPSGGNVSQFPQKAREQIEPAVAKAKEQLDAGIDKAADGLDSGAERLKGMSDQYEGIPAQAGSRLADSMGTTATYLRQHSSDEVLHNIKAYVRRHPTRSLIGAVMAGFVLARIWR